MASNKLIANTNYNKGTVGVGGRDRYVQSTLVISIQLRAEVTCL